MASTREDYQSYSKLTQFYKCFQQEYPVTDCVEKALPKIRDINYQFPANSRMISRDSNLAGATALHIAAIKNNIEIFDTLIKMGADITIQNQQGRTALHCAFLNQIRSVDKKIFIHIATGTQLSFGDPSNPSDFDGISHFHIACANNKVALVELFLNSGIPVDSTVNIDAKKYAGYTPLHFAAESCAIGVIKLLLKHNANMTAKDARGLTPFHMLLEEKITLMDTFDETEKPMSNSHIDAIDETLNQLMDANDIDEFGLTHFHISCAMRDTSVAEYYLDEQRVDVEQQVKMTSPFRPGYTALHFATHCNLNIAKMLLRRRANFEVRSASGFTQMDLFWQKERFEDLQTILNDSWKYTMFSDNRTRLLDFVNCLRVGNADALTKYLRGLTDPATQIKGTPTRWSGRTLLHFAVLMCQGTQAIETCMKFGLGTNVDTPDVDGATPIHLAFRANKLDIVDLLIKNNQVPDNLVDNDGLSYLHIACALGKLDYVNRFFLFSQNNHAKSVCRGSYAHALVKPGSTALHIAMAGGNCNIIEKLLSRGQSVRVIDDEGQTPLHRFLRLKENIRDVCCILLWSNEVSDPMLEEIGLTRLHMAIYCGEPIDVYVTPSALKATIRCDDPSSFLHKYNGYTPLHLAMKLGVRTQLVETLLEGDSSGLLTLNQQGDCPFYAFLTSKYDHSIAGTVLNVLQCNRQLRTQMEEMSGITMLHLACHLVDPVAVGWLLVGDGNTRARVKADCPVWPGDTPVHVLMRAAERGGADKRFCDTLLGMMQRGVDVMARNEDGETPIHLAVRCITASGIYKVLTILVQNLKDFSTNPSSRDGWTHFHAACLVSNASVVKSFLENDVDVNQPIDLFAKDLAGETPLHLAVEHRTELGSRQYQAQYDIVSCLLEKGADVTAEDARGNTALHLVAAIGNGTGIMKLLVENGASIDSRNIYDHTPLELLIRSNNMSVEGIKFFENAGCPINDTNVLTKQSYLSMLISRRYGACPIAVQRQCYQAVLGTIDGSALDHMGRSLLHNIVTTKIPESQVLSHHDLIEKLQGVGVDLDLKDKTGKTALHLAATCANEYAVNELLEAGADVNVVDSNNRTAADYAVDCYSTGKCNAKLVTMFVSHIRQLETIRLHVNVRNFQAKANAIRDLVDKRAYYPEELTFEDIHRVMYTLIGNTEILVRDFLTDKGKGLVSYPFMSDARRDSVDTFFRKYKGQLRDVCKLQYRKAVKRVELVELARNSVWAIAKTNVPIDCIEIIFQYLTNGELKNFVEGTKVIDVVVI